MIAGLILAAGESSRMGRDKALLPYRGRTFLETIIHTLREAGIERVAVVLGHHAEEIRRAANLEGVETVVNPDYQRGQTSSLQAGLRALAKMRPEFSVAAASSPPSAVPNGGDEDIAATAGEIEAIVLCLVDHPAVTSASIRKLVECFLTSRASVVIPTYQSQRGHPVVIGRDLFSELQNLSPGEGANLIVRKHRDQTRFVEVDDPGILLDVDDPDTYGHLETH
jgi:molybdenum cofactor cytidylyltransferase